jgi:hypothetical protein
LTIYHSMKKFIGTIVCTMCTVVICAQLTWLSAGQQPLPGAYSRNFHHLFSVLQQQAALAYVPSVTAGVTTEQRFLLKALSSHTAALAMPGLGGGLSLIMQQSGYHAYRQRGIGFGYGRTLGHRCGIGIQIDHLSKTIPQYMSASTLTFELSCILHLTSQLHAAIHAFNPAHRKLYGELLPVVYTVGMGYEVSPDFLCSIAVKQENDAAPFTKFMCDYRPVAAFSLQLGLSTEPQFSTLGMGVYLNRLYISCTAHYHPQLGITPQIALVWQAQ